MGKSTFVQNVQADGGDDGDEAGLPLPTFNFTRRNGADVSSDGRNDDGRTPGDRPRARFGKVSTAGVSGKRNPGSGDRLDSGGDDGSPSGTVGDTGKIECSQCGYEFHPQPEKPLMLPAPASNGKKEKPQYPSASLIGMEDEDEPGDQAVVNCPRCGASA